MLYNTSSAALNLMITLLVFAMVIFMPMIDVTVCKRLGLNLHRGLNPNPKASRIRLIRRITLLTVFSLYIFIVLWLVFFSRTAANEFKVNNILLKSLHSSLSYDTGLPGAIWDFITTGKRDSAVFSDLGGLYLNIMLFVPPGYLLPYCFNVFRRGSGLRPIFAGLLASLAIENLQLITKHGLYDVDDLIANTIGAIIGCLLFKQFAYVVTHPDWRKELHRSRFWNRKAHRSALQPLARHVRLSRFTLYASDRSEVAQFYVNKLGFRPLRSDPSSDTLLLHLGYARLEFRFTSEAFPPQRITLYARDPEKVRNNLIRVGLSPDPLYADPATGKACTKLIGPDNTEIIWID